jgi:hypothetical protein
MAKDQYVRSSPKAVGEAVLHSDTEEKRILDEDLKFSSMLKLDLDSLKRRHQRRYIF